MATFRLNFLMRYGKQGFSETWYRTSGLAKDAAEFQTSWLRQFLNCRPAGTTLQAVRAADVDTPRNSYLRVYNYTVVGSGVAVPGGLADVPQACFLISLLGASFRTRPYEMRCVNDDDITYDANQNPIFGAALLQRIGNWALNTNDMGLMFRTLNPATNPANPDRPVTSLMPVPGDPTQTVVNYLTTDIPDRARVIFHHVSRQTFPGLSGTLPSIPGNAGQIILPLLWRSPAASINGGPMTVRQALYSYTSIAKATLTDFRVRKVGRVFLAARGRRSAVRYRSR
jgi:hypothetical protein